MNSELISIDDEIISLASSIKKNMVGPAGQHIDQLELRVLSVENSIVILTRTLIINIAVLTINLGILVYFTIR